MAVGDIRLLTREEWTRPTQPPYQMVRHPTGAVPAGGDGWGGQKGGGESGGAVNAASHHVGIDLIERSELPERHPIPANHRDCPAGEGLSD
jgi:hypothetical protein